MHPVIPVFIASPGDVTEERKLAEEAVRLLAPRLARMFKVALVPLRWEAFSPISSSEARHPQRYILQQIEPYSIFIGILFRRYGTEILDMGGASGTETEFDHAIKNRDRIKILTYFRDQERGKIPNLTDDIIHQLEGVNKLKEKLKGHRIWDQSYRGTEEFRKRILLDLLEAVLQMVITPDDSRRRHYLHFFRFGSDFSRERGPVFIVYPPIRHRK